MADQRAADQGKALAQLMLGIILSGNKVPQDDAEAAKWFRKVGDQGNADAETALGLMYLAGRGVPQNDEAAVSWLRKAADQGVAEAAGEHAAALTLPRAHSVRAQRS